MFFLFLSICIKYNTLDKFCSVNGIKNTCLCISMKENKSSCIICGTDYTSEESGVCDDSHVSYITYHKCPNCSYTPLLEERLKKIIENEIISSIFG